MIVTLLQEIQLKRPVPARVAARLLPFGKYQLPGIGALHVDDALVQQLKENFGNRVTGTDVPVLVGQHLDERGGTAGWVRALTVQEDGLWAEFEATELGRRLLEDDQFRYVSVNFLREWKHPETGQEFKNVLLEITLTNFPALSGAVIMLSLDRGFLYVPLAEHREEWRANRPRFPLHGMMDREWDADAAESRWRDFTTSEGEVDFDEYRRGVLAYDAAHPEQFGSYKLLVVDVIDGEPHVIRRAVIAVQQALEGARGGVDLPQEVQAQVRRTADALRERFEKMMEGEMQMTVEELSAVLDAKLKPMQEHIVALQSLADEQKKKEETQRVELAQKQIADELIALRFERVGDSVRLSGGGNLAIPPAVAQSHARTLAKLPEADRQAELNALKQSPPTLVPLGTVSVMGGNGHAAGTPREAAEVIALRVRELREKNPEWNAEQVMVALRRESPDLVTLYERRHVSAQGIA